MIHTKTKIRSLLLLTSLGLSLCAQAGEDYSKRSPKTVIEQPVREPRFWLSLAAGGEFDVHATKFISNGDGTLFSGGVGLPAKIQSRDFRATHDIGVINARLEVGYIICPAVSLFAGFTYSHADGDEARKAGRVSDPTGAFGRVGGVYDIYANVSDYNAYAGMGGIKLILPPTVLDSIHVPRAIAPYISASAGGKYVEATDVSFFNGGNNRFLNTGRAQLYDDSWVFTGEVNLGLDITVARSFSVVVETGYGYDTKPEAGGQVLPGLNGVDRGGDRVYNTVSLGGKVKF
jgi:hypothetical protein